MGLDMYLKATLWLSKFDKSELKLAKAVRKLVGVEFDSGNLDSTEVTIEVAYWRKANHIHRWFVKNVQNGVDDCKDYFIDRESLKELLKLCEEVDKDHNKAKTLLPVEEGFFFGGNDYGEWYFDDIKDTISQLKKCLELPEDWEFKYHSSW